MLEADSKVRKFEKSHSARSEESRIDGHSGFFTPLRSVQNYALGSASDKCHCERCEAIYLNGSI